MITRPWMPSSVNVGGSLKANGGGSTVIGAGVINADCDTSWPRSYDTTRLPVEMRYLTCVIRPKNSVVTIRWTRIPPVETICAFRMFGCALFQLSNHV